MKKQFIKSLAFGFPIIAFMFGWIACEVMAQETDFSPPTKTDEQVVIVLQNSSVLIGEIEQHPQGIKVTTDSGSKLSLRFEQVDFFADSLDEAFQKLVAKGDLADFNQQHKIFQWCLRYRLFDKAANLLSVFSELGVDEMQLRSFQRQLTNSIEQAANPRQLASNNETEPGGFKPINNLPSNAELEKQNAKLPEKSMLAFTRHVQPKIMVGCSAGNCHGSETANYRLWRNEIGRSVPVRYAQRNLYATVQRIDLENPAVSKLLEKAKTAHGEQKEPGFDKNSREYLILEYWVYSISNHPEKYYDEYRRRYQQQVAAQQRRMGIQPTQPNAVSNAVQMAGPDLTAEPDVKTVSFEETIPSPPKDEPHGKDATPVASDPTDPVHFNRKQESEK